MVLKIAVLVKQVLADSEGKMDAQKGILIRKGAPQKMNACDYDAIETAVQIKQALKDVQIYCITMGPKDARNILSESLSLGADSSYHLCDTSFSGADALVTSYTLSQAVRLLGEIDIIICGKQSTDGDTGQVPAGIAGYLSIPFLGAVDKILTVSNTLIEVGQTLSHMKQEVQVHFPVVLAVEKGIYPRRIPSLPAKLSALKKEITTLGLSDLPDTNRNHYGMSGSSTRVTRIYSAIASKKEEVNEKSSEEQAAMILSTLQENRVI